MKKRTELYDTAPPRAQEARMAAALCGLLLLAMTPSAAVETGPPPPATSYVLFTYPSSSGPDMTLVDGLVDLIERAAPGATIRISMYIVRDATEEPVDRILTALEQAAYKAQVHLVLDDTNEGGPYGRRRLADIVRASAGGGGRFILCEAGCMGSHSTDKNHNKFMLISELDDGARDVVVQSSANWTTKGLTGKHQNTVVSMGDRAMYEAYEAYWLDLAGASRSGDEAYGWETAAGDGTTVLFFPRVNEPDPLVGALAQVICQPDGGTHIRMAMSKWTPPREAIAEELKSLRAKGCLIDILLSDNSTNQRILDLLDGSLAARCVDYLHSKYLLVETQGSEGPEYVVWTGSHNYTGRALLHNDEVLLKLVNQGLYAAFLADWQRINDSAHRC